MQQHINNSIDYFRKVREGLSEVKKLNFSALRKVFSLMGKYEKIVFVVLICLALVASWLAANSVYTNNTKPAPAFGGTYREGIVGQPRLINPALATSSVDTTLIHLIYSGLYTYDADGKLVPDLAEGEPRISEDQKEYTVKIKSGAIFHNDRPVTADDVIFTIQTIKNPSFKSPLRNDWQNTTVEKVSDNEVKFKNGSISAPFVQNLTIPILPEKQWSRVDADTFQLSEMNIKPIGSGPYQIKEISKLPSGNIQKITLESFKAYTSGRPYIDRIVIQFYENYEDVTRAFRTGEISGFAYAPYTQDIDSQDKIQIDNSELVPLSQYQALFYNTQAKIFSDLSIRKALALAVPKQNIISDVFKGEARPLNSPILPEQLGFIDLPELPFDPATAANELDQLGYKVNENGIRAKKDALLEVTLATNDSPLNVKTAELISKEWQKLNVKVNLVNLSTKELTEKNIRPRNFDALVFGQKMSADPDPFAFWHSSQTKDPGLNVSGYSNVEADGLITEARTTIISDIRQDRYEKFLELVNNDIPAVFLSQQVMVYPVSSDVKRPVVNALYDSSLRFNQISKWYIKEKRVLK